MLADGRLPDRGSTASHNIHSFHQNIGYNNPKDSSHFFFSAAPPLTDNEHRNLPTIYQLTSMPCTLAATLTIIPTIRIRANQRLPFLLHRALGNRPLPILLRTIFLSGSRIEIEIWSEVLSPKCPRKIGNLRSKTGNCGTLNYDPEYDAVF